MLKMCCWRWLLAHIYLIVLCFQFSSLSLFLQNKTWILPWETMAKIITTKLFLFFFSTLFLLQAFTDATDIHYCGFFLFFLIIFLFFFNYYCLVFIFYSIFHVQFHVFKFRTINVSLNNSRIYLVSSAKLSFLNIQCLFVLIWKLVVGVKLISNFAVN